MFDRLASFLRSLAADARARMWAPVAAVSVPIAVAAVRAAAGDWIPIRDDAYFTMRSRDVLTGHHPLVGAWSSGSNDIESHVNNLGPMQLDLLAPFTKVAPMGGTAIGVAVTNIAAVVTLAWLVARVVGRRAVVFAMVPVAMLTWTMGSEMLITPRQHQYLVLPYLCLLVAVWAIAAGEAWAWIPAVVAGSLVTQTHLSYPVLALAVGAVAVGGQVLAVRRSGERPPVRAWAIAAGVTAVLWFQPFLDQVAGRGNFTTALTTPGEVDANGFGTGLRIAASTLVSTSTLLRPGFRPLSINESIWGAWRPVVLLVALAVALAGLWLLVRRRSVVWSAGVAVAIVAVAAGVVDAALLPESFFGIVSFYYRWLWSTGAFVAMVAVLGARAWLARHEPARTGLSSRWRSAAAGAAMLAVVVFSAANLATSVEADDAGEYLADRERVRLVLEQLDSIEFESPVVVDASRVDFGLPYTYPLLVALDERAIEFRLETERMARRFGDGRRPDGTEAQRLTLYPTADADEYVDRPELVAHVDGPRGVAIVLEGR